MRQNTTKIVIGILVLIIIGIFIYLWFLVTVWAISFIVTILAVALIVTGLFRLKYWLNNKKNKRHISRRKERGEFINKRSEL